MFYSLYQYKNNRNIKLAPEQKLTLERNSQQRYRHCPWHPVQYSVLLYCALLYCTDTVLTLQYNALLHCIVQRIYAFLILSTLLRSQQLEIKGGYTLVKGHKAR